MDNSSVLNGFDQPSSGSRDNTLQIGGTWKIAGEQVNATAEQLNNLSSNLTVANKTGSTITKGSLVYLSGYDTTLVAPTVVLADASDGAKAATHVAIADILNDEAGVVNGAALLTGLNTSAFAAVGSLVYESATPGAFTETAPAATTGRTHIVGVVKTKHASTGSVYFFPVLGVNSVAKFNSVIATNPKTDYVKFLGLTDVIAYSVGTWTTTRVARGDYVKRKTATDETAIIGIDITEALRTATSKGLRLASFDVIHRNITADLDAHSVTLDKIAYVNSAVVSTTSVALTGTLPVGQDADPQVTNVVVDTPAFNNTDDSKHVLELTVNAGASSVYDFIGIMLKFARNDL